MILDEYAKGLDGEGRMKLHSRELAVGASHDAAIRFVAPQPERRKPEGE